MSGAVSAEPGSELFREDEGDEAVVLAFGPVQGGSPCWSLLLSDGREVERRVLEAPRPGRRYLRLWLAPQIGEVRALALLARVGRLQHFYAGYYAARPDLEQRHLVVA